MRQRNVKNCDEILLSSDKYEKDIQNLKQIIKDKKYHNLCLEIGIGKGAFIAESAFKNKDNLYIGIELNKGVVALALKKIKRFEDEREISLKNLYVLDYNALELLNIFSENEVDTIYLNFSDPWPKKKHEKRRLTSNTFLDIYKKILKADGKIELKTDNRHFFEYSLVNMNNFKMTYEYTSLDLHRDIEDGKIEDNIVTEYEEKFSIKGPIYKLITKF